MIPRRTGWIRREHGDSVVLTKAQCTIRYRERVRPLRTFDEQLAELLAIEAIAPALSGTPERFRTDEGEQAALARLSATVDGQRVTFVLASIIADDFFATLWGHAPEVDGDELAATIRALAQGTRLALGIRRRAVPHTAPVDWSTVAAGLATDHVAPGGHAALRVLPAEPTTDAEPITSILVATNLDGREVDEIEGPFELPAREGAFASSWRFRAGSLVCEVVTLRDAHYDYTFVLEARDATAADRHRAALHALVASIQPFAPSSQLHGHGAFAHWAA